MNPWQDELTAEYNRNRVREEIEQIRLEKRVRNARVYRPRAFERTMFRFANWMIATGKQLRKRYEMPAVNCSNNPTSSYAR